MRMTIFFIINYVVIFFMGRPTAPKRRSRRSDTTNDCKMEDGSWRRQETPYMTFTEADLDAADKRAAGEFKAVPEGAAMYLTYFYKKFIERNQAEIHQLYEATFTDLSNRYFKVSEWPSVEDVSPLVDNNSTFLLLYKELYYRHLFSKMSPTPEQRVDGWNNYCDLFSLFMSDETFEYELPASWLWDMVDEFIYQFESWCQYRSRLTMRTSEEIAFLRDSDGIWNVQTVLRLLHVLVHKSSIIEWLLASGRPGINEADDQLDRSSLSTYRYLGYFAIIGLSRVNTLLGDYNLALMLLQPIDFSITTALFTHVTAAHVSINYYMGFCYMMLRRYEDAVRVFSSTVLHIGRIKHNHTRSYQYEQIDKRNSQMMALLAACMSLRPQQVDESVLALVREKAGDRYSRMSQGEIQAYEDMFEKASPKFVSPALPNYDVIVDSNMDAPRHQMRLFVREVSHQLESSDIRSYLKLYTSIEIDKLAALTDSDESTIRSRLHSLKHKSWALVGSTLDSPLDGQYQTASDLGFNIDGNVIRISDSVQTAMFGEYFIHQIGKLDDLLGNLMRKLDDSPANANRRVRA